MIVKDLTLQDGSTLSSSTPFNDVLYQTQNVDSFNVSTPDTTTTTDSTQSATMPSFYESQKYLYETGLQNIFNDYQANIATLDKEKQQSIEDAYVIREMSKKYLGEYASNTGIGDVSGNLLDVYSKYQENISAINENYSGLETNLTQEYQQAKLDTYNKILETQYNMQVEQLDQAAKDAMFNITSGNTNGMTDLEYLDSIKGTISTDQYQAIYGALYGELKNTVSQNLSTGYYGVNSEGKAITDPNEYLAQYEGQLNEKDFQELQNIISYSEQTQSGTELNLETGINISDYVTSQDVNPTSDVYSYSNPDGTTSYLFEIQSNVDNELDSQVDSATLDEEFTKQFGTSAELNATFEYNRNYYIAKQDGWHRMVGEDVNPGEIVHESKQVDWVLDKKPSKNPAGATTFTLDGNEYDVEDKLDSGTLKYSEILAKFQEIHPYENDIGVQENSVIQYDGQYYVYTKKGDISLANPRTTTDTNAFDKIEGVVGH